jgi:hypothetical protein
MFRDRRTELRIPRYHIGRISETAVSNVEQAKPPGTAPGHSPQSSK